jgi:GDPmannose 4,6-dehydratase
MSSRRALITGISGQDGSYLAELLLDKGYEVVGTVRGDPSHSYANLEQIQHRLDLINADLLDQASLTTTLATYEPHELYNLAFVSFAPTTWRHPLPTAELGAIGITALLESIRQSEAAIRFYQASSSEIFGRPHSSPQTEDTPLSPLSPYGVAKAYGHFLIRSYRDHYGLHASSGILYNHESPRRATEFVTRKITDGAAAIKLGLRSELRLGDIEARRDWGYAPDYVRAMWLMTQQDEPDDYVIATGITHSVEELAAASFEYLGLDWRDYVNVDASLQRGKAQLHNLTGDPSKAREKLGWTPTVPFDEIVRIMVDADLACLGAERSQDPTGGRGSSL